MTIRVLITLGKMCLNIRTGGLTPSIRARVTKSWVLTDSTSPRTIRANLAHTVSATASMMTPIPVPRMTTITSATRMVGKPRAASVIRMIMVSVHPPA